MQNGYEELFSEVEEQCERILNILGCWTRSPEFENININFTINEIQVGYKDYCMGYRDWYSESFSIDCLFSDDATEQTIEKRKKKKLAEEQQRAKDAEDAECKKYEQLEKKYGGNENE